MNFKEIVKQIRQKETFLCVGLDTDIEKVPSHLRGLDDAIFVFNKAIIDATAPFCMAFKPNTAFYESQGLKGYKALVDTIDYINKNHPHHFIIADAKRGDIGNTAAMYAKAFFEEMQADALTVAPYMGKDSVTPFLEFKNKWAVVLGLTSNKGAEDFQTINDPPLYQQVLKKVTEWGTQDNLMFVIGATQASLLKEIRTIIPDHFLLVPGVGAQGGSLAEVAKYGMNKNCGLIVNASRSIIYASTGNDYAEKAAEEARSIQAEMAVLLKQYC